LLGFLGEEGLGRAALLRVLRPVSLDPRDLELQLADSFVELELGKARKVFSRQLAGGIAVLARALGLFH
tara:strand:- start:856 stop:1062 length:207 start_codon:yes stop_codon:yes gene_type:complete